VAIDGLRADHVGVLGYDRATTPTLDRLAREGVAFRQAFAAAPLARPSHLALITGCDPFVSQRFLSNELKGRRWNVPAAVPRLAVEFLAAGYETAAFLDGDELRIEAGIERGFQRFVVLREDAGSEPTQEQVARVLSWLRMRTRESWFAYVHLADLERCWRRPRRDWERYFEARAELDHVPPVGSTDEVFFALPFSRWRGGSRTLGEYEASYDGHLVKLDKELDALFAGIRRLGLEESTTIVVLGTHGTQFGEAGLILESGCYSTADLNVPWILRPRPGVLPRPGEVRREVVSLLDLAPTLLALEGLAVPRGMHGRSLAGLIDGTAATLDRRFVLASCGVQQGCAVLGEQHCLEYLAPGQLASGFLRRAWFGEPHDDDQEEGAETVVRFYDRIAEPYPSLVPRSEPRAEEFHAYREAAARWIGNMQDARLVLQGGLHLGEEVPDARVRELIELGYLGEGVAR